MAPKDKEDDILDRALCILARSIKDRPRIGQLPEALRSHAAFLELQAELEELKDFAASLAQGDLTRTTKMKGFTIGALRSIQANLRHLTWQTQRIAQGDYTQRVDFMGDFSAAFNSMTETLAQTITLLHEREKQYRLLTENLMEVIWTLDRRGCFTYVSPSVEALTGFLPEELLGRSVLELIRDEERELIADGLKRAMSNPEAAANGVVVEFQSARKDGSLFWSEVTASNFIDEHGSLVGLVGIIRDVTERKKLQEELLFLASRDSLTGAYNRRQFLELGEMEAARSERHHCPLALLMIDIDRFKRVNDTYGHKAGDQVLCALVKTAGSALRTMDIFSRFGGEEFAVLLPETGPEEALFVAERLREAMTRTTVQADKRQISFTVSIGVASRTASGFDLEQMLQEADAALYRAKTLGRNRVCLAEKKGPV